MGSGRRSSRRRSASCGPCRTGSRFRYGMSTRSWAARPMTRPGIRWRGKRLCSVDKANVLETSRLWRETVIRISEQYPDVELSHMLVDNCAMQLVRDPRQFDVIVTENFMGDVISDQCGMLTGSLGMLP